MAPGQAVGRAKYEIKNEIRKKYSHFSSYILKLRKHKYRVSESGARWHAYICPRAHPDYRRRHWL